VRDWYEYARYHPSYLRRRGSASHSGSSEKGDCGNSRSRAFTSTDPIPCAEEQKQQASLRAVFVTAFIAGLAAIAAAAIGSLIVALVSHRSTVSSPVPEEIAQKPTPLIVAKLERFSSVPAMQKLLSQIAPSSLPLISRWNLPGPQHFIFGEPLTSKHWYYALVPRKGWETGFIELHAQDVNLYEIHLRADLPNDQVEGHLYLWAAHCGVAKAWIDQWSWWRTASAKGSREAPMILPPEWQSSIGLQGQDDPDRAFFVLGNCDASAIRDFIRVQNSFK
jgi:hypothetical protein